MKYGIVFGLASSVGGRGGGGRAVAPERQVVSSGAGRESTSIPLRLRSGEKTGEVKGII